MDRPDSQEHRQADSQEHGQADSQDYGQADSQDHGQADTERRESNQCDLDPHSSRDQGEEERQ